MTRLSMQAIRKRAALPAAVGLLALLSACGAGLQYVPVDIRDDGASIVSVRADRHPRKRQEGTGGLTVEDGIEFQYLRAVGDDSQALPAGQVLSIGGRSIIRPQQVSHRAEVNYSHLAYGGPAN